MKKLMTSIFVRILLIPLVLVLVNGFSLLYVEVRSERSLSQVIASHDEATRTKETIQKAIGDLATAQQNAYNHLTLVDSGIEKAKLLQLRSSIADHLTMVRSELKALGQVTGQTDAENALAVLASYEKVANQMAQMAEIDRLMGLQMLGSADDYFSKMMAALQLWRSHIDQHAADTVAALQRDNSLQRLVSWVVIGLINLAALLLVLMSSRGITLPLRRLETRMIALTEGDLASEVADRQLVNEIGRMARAVDVFKSNAIERQRLEMRERDVLAQRNARQKCVEQHTEDFDRAVGKLMNGLSSSVDALRNASGSMTAIAEQTHRQSSTVSSVTNEAGASVSTIAAACNQMSASIDEIGRQVDRAAKVAAHAVNEAGRTSNRIERLAAAASRIGEVVDLITGIASQTNLLALNATIEAARAGDAGKGFAVVANEVKQLANQTAKATDDISSQVGGIQEESRQAVEAIGTITNVIGEISEHSSAISGAVEQQGAAIKEIVRNVEQAAEGTRAIARSIAQVENAARSTGQAAEMVETIAGDLQQENKALESAVVQFLEGVKSA